MQVTDQVEKYPVTMDDTSVSKSVFPWLWVIEALAASKEMATFTLKDLIDIAPVKPDVFGKNTGELVARRCLESLFDFTKASNSDTSSNLDSKVQFDNSQSCEDVLQSILREIPLENLRIGGAELLKWDGYPFIMHKKAITVKCELEQLKESVLVNGGHLEHVRDVKCNYLLRNGDDCTYAENMGVKEKLVYQHGKEVSENSSARLIISEREGFLTEKDQMATVEGGSILEDRHGGYTASNRCGCSSYHQACYDQADIPYNGTMIPQHRSGAEPSQHHVESVPTNTALLDESVPENCLGISMTIPQQTSWNEPCQNTSLHETNHDTELHTEAILTNVDLADEIQNEIEECLSKYEINFLLKEFKAASPNGPQQSVAVVDPGNGAEASGDSDGYHHKKIDLAAKMHEFLSSQRMPGQDLSASTEWTPQRFCMKCNVGGELLVCTMTRCPLVAHESCLGTLPKFDIKGNFFCPFCAYFHAISEYLEGKKKVSLARKELAIFIHKGIGHEAKEISDLFRTKEPIPSRKRNHNPLHIKNNGSDQLLGREDNREDHVSEHVNEVNSIQKSQQQTEPSASCDDINSLYREKEILSDGIQQQAEPSASCANVNISCREKEIENNGKLKRNNVSDHVYVADKFSRRKRNNVSVNQSDRQKGTLQKMPEQSNTYGIEKPISACATVEEISEDEFCRIISAFSMRTQKQEMQCTPQASFHLRRLKVPWTADEEDILREGVQKFSSDTTMNRRIPWKKILKFGCNVFLNDRTTVDLKDKWRNMCKASLKSK